MDPMLGAALIVGGLVLVLGLAFGLLAYGRHTRSAEVDVLKESVARAEARADRLESEALARASGARHDLRRAADRAGAVAAGDDDGVLQQFPSSGEGAPAGQPSDLADT